MTRPPRLAWRKRLRVRAPCLALFGYTLLLAADGTGVLRIGILCALMHESGHIAAYLALLRRFPTLELSLGGVCLSLRGVQLPPGRMLALAAAGPAVNLLLAAAVLAWMGGPGRCSYRGMWFAAVNLLVGGFNLLPLPMLDGGQIAASLRALAGRRR